MRISDWSSDVCSSDLPRFAFAFVAFAFVIGGGIDRLADRQRLPQLDAARAVAVEIGGNMRWLVARQPHQFGRARRAPRSEERRVGKECVSTCRSRWVPDP